ncbi:MAG: tyrosine-type recombinase/integrase [bacterium]
MASSRRSRRWSWTTGEKGKNRVRVFDRGSRGIFLDTFVRDPLTGTTTRKRISLGRVDREFAKRKTEELAATLRVSGRAQPQTLTVGALFDSYEANVTPSKGVSARKHDKRALMMLGRFLGAHRPVETLDRRDWDAFIRDRRAGRLRPAGVEEPKAVKNRAVEQDLRLLLAVFNWAMAVRDAGGKRLLASNPLAGFTVPREENPRRPILTHDEFERLLAAAPTVSPTMETLLVVANATGHRINSIRLLRWSDIDFQGQTIRWRGEQDKIGHEHVTPMVEEARLALLKHRLRAAAQGQASSWVFPAPSDPDQPLSRHLARHWWERTEAAADIARIPGRGWHSLRRKFATELKGASLRDLCALGGWKDHNTILKCYQQPDPAAMRLALENRATLRTVS